MTKEAREMFGNNGPCPHCGNNTYERLWGILKRCERCGRVFKLHAPPKPAAVKGEVQGG